MFTGLVETIGTISETRWEPDEVSERLTIHATDFHDLALGESIAVNGVCLTVVDISPHTFSVQVSPTTLALTSLGSLNIGDRVNLERSVTPTTRLGGHWVLGHVDTTGKIAQISAEGEAHHVNISYNPEFSDLILPLGSVTLDGVSLTVVSAHDGEFRVTLIPHTQHTTTLGGWKSGHPVNIEFDILGKYIKHLLSKQGG
jgi:riboflavin synthase